MMLAERVEWNRPFDRVAQVTVRLAVALRREGLEQLGVALVAAGGVEERAHEAAWGVGRRRRLEIHAEGREYLGHVALEGAHLLLCDVPWAQMHRLLHIFVVVVLDRQ